VSDSIRDFVVCTDTALGDGLMAMVAIQEIARQRPFIYLYFGNSELQLPMRPLNAQFMDRVPDHGFINLINLNVHKLIQKYGRHKHLILQYLEQAGFECDHLPTPHYIPVGAYLDDGTNRNELELVPEYDFIIAPFSNDFRRTWPLENYVKLIEALLFTYGASSKIAIIGGKNDPKPLLVSRQVKHEYGWSIAWVYTLMKRARKAIITVDSGPSRLAHVAGVKNHVLLAPDWYVLDWQTHPGAFNVVGNRDTWTVSNVMLKVHEAVVACQP